ncbi:ubiquitin carboxyl-terminal hydrolase 16-like isoform X2 [Pecten maximus]|uniref:ubiquitin carboxyl-terminal hydrolase 16-like isoform X2 n=1 Tax=Pecten maximus TaxID=6579 RepID=UPI001458C345|nr:ubiquitin carboxyl-terminal hydrolase 16-like isoform X2 [Pecten maximus]
MAVPYIATLGFFTVIYGCLFCTGFPIGHVDTSVERYKQTMPELNSSLYKRDWPITIPYCANHFHDDVDSVSVSPHHVQGTAGDPPLKNWDLMEKIWGRIWSIPVTILIFFSMCMCFKERKYRQDFKSEHHQQVWFCGTLQQRETIPCIPNVGNTCYMNAVLQALCWTPNFREQLQTSTESLGPDDLTCTDQRNYEDRKTNGGNTPSPRIDRSLLALVKNVQDGKRVPETLPKAILCDIRQLNDIFQGHNQRDSYELFNTVINGLEDLSLKMVSGDHAHEKALKDREQCMNASPVSRLFGGVFVTVFTYSSCQHVETSFQRFTSIPVQTEKNYKGSSFQKLKPHGNHVENSKGQQQPWQTLPCLRTLNSKGRGQTDLETGLAQWTDINENLGNLRCRLCPSKSEPDTNTLTRTRLMLLSLPPVLVFQFNRYTKDNGKLKKFEEYLSYPEYLDVAPFCSSAFEILGDKDHKAIWYRLYGIVCHHGSIKGGHYTSRVRTTGHHKEDLKTRFLTQDWNDPERCAQEMLTFWTKTQDNDTDNDGDTDSIKKEQENRESHSKNNNSTPKEDTWYTVSDTRAQRCTKQDALYESSAYILMYERL